MTKEFLIILSIILSLISCGKKVKNNESDSNPTRDGRDNIPDIVNDEGLRRFIEAQDVKCADESNCPESVAKLVVIERDNVRYCTGTLVSKNTMVTSSSCLLKSLRIPGINCQKNIFAIFPKIGRVNKITVGCQSVISSDTNEQDLDPALIQSDLAFIKLNSDVDRYYSFLSRRGLSEYNAYKTFKMDYINDYEGVIKEKECQPFYNSFANPFVTSSYSPLITLSQCSLIEGNHGAPIVDYRGYIVGISSLAMDKKIGTSIMNQNLLTEPMAEIQHVTNMACANIPSEIYRYSKRKECDRDINIGQLDTLRRKILLNTDIHRDEMIKIKNELESPLKYFKWKIKFYANSEGNVFEPNLEKLNCFYDINSWINEFKGSFGRYKTWVKVNFKLPNYKLQTKLNGLLQPVSIVNKIEDKDYGITFNPRYAFHMKNTTTIVTSSVHGNETNERFDDITDRCR